MCPHQTHVHLFLNFLCYTPFFKGYTPFSVITKYWLYLVDIHCISLYITVAYLTPNTLYLPLFCLYINPQHTHWWTLVCSLYLWRHFFYVIFTSSLYFLNSMQKVISYSLCLSLSGLFHFMPSESIHVAANGKIFIFSVYFVVCVCVCVCLRLYPFIWWTYVGYFYDLDTVNRAVVNTKVHGSFQASIFGFFWIHTREWNCWVIW